jgi:eukaryotic-like serine/threonine-protein kinase
MSSNTAAHALSGKALGHYRLIEKIGSGGMGDVYRARDEHLNREVAIKILPPGTLADDFSLRQFRQEAIALSRVNHSNIATIHDFDTQEGVGFLVMEFIPGVTLNDKLGGRALPQEDLINLGLQIASALEEAHEQGVVHKDIKSRNIMVTPKGLAKILDFGLAKITHGSSNTDLTVSRSDSRVLAGTYPYMSPEQLRGTTVDRRSDIYSFGVVLYEMATGQLPFCDPTFTRLVDAILNHSPVAPSSLNPAISLALEGLILKALDKNPERRYQTAGEMRLELQRLLTSKLVVQPIPPPLDQATIESQNHDKRLEIHFPWGSRKTQFIALLSLLGTFAALFGLYHTGEIRPTEQPSLVERQLTSNSPDHHVLTSAISPDGNFLAYAEPSGLFLRAIGSGDVRKLPLPGDFYRRIGDVVWTPTGSELLVTLAGLHENDSASIWTVPLLGQGEPHKLLEPAANPAISPDGTMIAFTTVQRFPVKEIWIAKINGEASQKWLENAGQEAELLSSAVWSPDGRWILYEKMKPDFSGGSIEMKSLSGGETRTIFSEARLPHLALDPSANHPLRFSPDWQLFFAAVHEDAFLTAGTSLWQVTVNPDRLDVAQPRKLVEWPDLTGISFSISAHGDRIAIKKMQYQSGVFLGRLGKNRRSLDAVHRFTPDTRTSFPTGWTSDSEQLLFVSAQTGTPKIFKQGVEGGVPERITSGSGRELGPQVSPDDASILYAQDSGTSRADPSRLMIISVAGAQPRVLFETNGSSGFRCPHVKGLPCLIAQPERGEVVFYSMDPVRGRGDRVAKCKPEEASDWDLSPDGTRLVALGGANSISVMNMTGADRVWHKLKLKTSLEGSLDQITWKPDGSGFFLAARLRPYPALGGSLLDIGLDGHWKILWQAPIDRVLTYPLASPNGKYLAFGVIVWNSDVWLLEHF